MKRHEKSIKIALIFILAVYLILGLLYSVTAPVLESSDELWHYPMVQHLASNGLALPVLRPEDPGPWRQEGAQPPLYYFLAALATLNIDTADLPAVREINPHADVGIVRPDGNANMIMHDAARESFPWHGAVLAIHVARFFSVLLGAGTVLTTFLIGREVFPDWSGIALGAAALNAFLPMFVFISASVNNDNLSNFLAGLLIWQLTRLLKMQSAPGYAAYVLLGITAGAGMLAKLSIGLLLPVVALALLAISLRTRSWRPLILGGLTSGGLTILIAGWWYLRNAQLYGDPTALNVFIRVVGERSPYADLAQLWAERESFLRAWWGLFGGVNVPLPDWVYTLLNIIGGIGLVGFALYLLRRISNRQDAETFPLLLNIFWPVATFVGLLQWSSVTPASQGRLMFVAIGPICLWLAVGLAWWTRQKWQRRIVGGVAGLYLLITVVALPSWIVPVYTPPTQQAAITGPPAGGIHEFYEPGMDLPALRLCSYTVSTVFVDSGGTHMVPLRPGESIDLRLCWEVLQTPTRRWSLFAHAIDSAGLIVGQRDRYPGRGLLRTEHLEVGQRWFESLTVSLPAGIYTPDELTLALGFYDRATGERMTTADGDEMAFLRWIVEILPLDESADVPNARQDNFTNLITLRGYEYSARRLYPGDPLTVTLYWQGQQDIERDYTVFVHVLSLDSTASYGGSDAYPADWTQPTSTWTPGETVIDPHMITLDPNTPPGVYQVEVGLYSSPQPGVFDRLRVIDPGGGQGADVVYLSQIAVDVPPEAMDEQP